MTKLENEDIQGIVLTGFGRFPYASYQLLTVVDRARAGEWLASRLESDRITTVAGRKEATRVQNLAFTPAGLTALGIDKSALDSFDVGFQEGMAFERKSQFLGDHGDSAPSKWAWGAQVEDDDGESVPTKSVGKDPGKAVPIHLISIVFASEQGDLDHDLPAKALKPLGEPLLSEPQGKAAGGKFAKEHFGFADGLSQPILRGTKRAKEGQDVAAGEFILGYENEYGHMTTIPAVPADDDEEELLPELTTESRAFGRNGSYLAFRQLEQNVPEFWNYFETVGKDDADAERLASKCVGRWPSGALITEETESDPLRPTVGKISFAESDPQGAGCPLGSHIRRMNPRDVGLGVEPELSSKIANRHQLLRRGRSYGPPIKDRNVDDKEKRGLFFLCLNGNLERQFEFVQHTWVQNPKFAGAYDELDPLIAIGPNDEKRQFRIPGSPLRQRLSDMPTFVTVRGGAYFFLPGIRALRYLATRAQKA